MLGGDLLLKRAGFVLGCRLRKKEKRGGRGRGRGCGCGGNWGKVDSLSPVQCAVGSVQQLNIIAWVWYGGTLGLRSRIPEV